MDNELHIVTSTLKSLELSESKVNVLIEFKRNHTVVYSLYKSSEIMW